MREWIDGAMLCLGLLCLTTPLHAEDALPTGFKSDRYRNLWERNPFTLVTPAVQVQPQAFSKLVVVSWLNDGGKDSLFVQDTDTNDVQKVTDSPNDKGLRIIEVHAKGGKDFQMIRDFEAVVSNGSEQGTIKFKPQATGPMVASNPINPMQVPPGTGQTNQVSPQVNAQMPGINPQASAPYANQNVAPQAQQTRRKRVLPPSAAGNAAQGGVPPQQQAQQIQQPQQPQQQLPQQPAPGINPGP